MIEQYQSMMLALRDTLGVVVDENHSQITDKLRPVMSEYNIESLDDLAHRLNEGEPANLRAGVLQAITSHDSAWTGYPGMASLLKEYILPDVLNRGKMDYRIWTVGCGHGQITWSLAMLIEEFREHSGMSTDFEIVATDISESAVEQAAQGAFRENMLEGLPPDYKHKYLVAHNGQWRINDDLRSMVSFSACDLLEPLDHMGHFDLIISPDVLVYFSSEVKRNILEGFADLLDPSGILIVGSGEPVAPFSDRFEFVEHETGVFYRQIPG